MVNAGVTPSSSGGKDDDASPVAEEFRTVLGVDLEDDATRAAVMRALGDELTASDGPVTALVANSVWIRNGDSDSGIKPAYVASLKRDFDARAERLPQSAAPINSWVSERTEGKITNLLDDAVVADPLLRVVLVNAVYFKGDWRRKFDPGNTVEAVFRGGGGGEEKCMMMNMEAEMPVVHTGDGAVAVALAYGNATSALRAVVYLPPSGAGTEMKRQQTRSVASVAADAAGVAGAAARAMTPAAWAEISEQLSDKRHLRNVALSMPRFKLEFGASDVSDNLRAMGLDEAFDGTGGFLAMSDDRGLHLSKVMHKAMAEVNEEGTEAAAASAAIMVTRSMPAPPMTVVVDRPFLFFVEDADSGAILFAGVVNSPGPGVA